LQDYEYNKAIMPNEFLGLAWQKEDREEKAPNLMKMMKRFNLVSFFVEVLLAVLTWGLWLSFCSTDHSLDCVSHRFGTQHQAARQDPDAHYCCDAALARAQQL
jgi:hypothetical protein